jgi:hypothetical protein
MLIIRFREDGDVGFGSVLIDQVYLGSVINLGLVGYFVVEIRVYKEEWRALLESR